MDLLQFAVLKGRRQGGITSRAEVTCGSKLVAQTDTRSLFLILLHPYIETLLSSVPKPDPRVCGYCGVRNSSLKSL